MPAHTQISAHISEETRKLVEAYVEAYGVKKGFLIESALLHHLHALRELPSDLIVPPRLVLSPESAERVLDLIENPREPTDAMKRLFDEEG